MRDESGAGEAETPEGSSPLPKGFYELKTEFLSSRAEKPALEVIDLLLATKVDEIDLDAWLDLKDLLVCVLDTITLPRLLTEHQIVLLKAINEAPPTVVDFLAGYFNRHIDDVQSLLATSQVAVAIAFARRVVEEKCAGSIANLLWRFAGVQLVCSELVNILKFDDDEKRFRVHQVTAAALKNLDDYAGLSPLLAALADEVNSRDILCKLNAVELLADAASHRPSAAACLQSAGIVDHLYSLLKSTTEDPDSGFLFPGAIKFFGHLSVVDPECLTHYPAFADALFDMVHHFDRLDVSLRLLAFDTFGVVGASDKSKLFLHTLSGSHDMNKVMNAFGAAIASGPAEMRVRHIEALTMFVRTEDPITEGVSDLMKGWFAELGEPFPPLMLAYMNRPFPDIRIAALEFLNEIFSYQWAIDTFVNLPGFLECLLNRSTETSSEGKQLKYATVCLLADRGGTSITGESMLKLKLYRREGPFYVEAPPEVGMEND